MVRRDTGVLKQPVIRNYESRVDRERVEDLERRCEVGPAERVFLLTDTLGDPICRIRNSPMYKMLVAELDSEIVGVIQGTIKVVTMNKAPKNKAKVGYVLGLRISPHHRRKGIASSLVRELEKWFVANEADYSYMATLKDNEASIKLFVGTLGYAEFTNPAILVNPVQNRPARISPGVEILKLGADEAEILYRRFMGSAEFFPHDVDKVLRNKLSLGTFVAYPKGETWKITEKITSPTPTSWAMVSVWNTGEVYKLWLKKAPLSCSIYTKSSRVMSKVFPCFGLLMPDFFDQFGFYFIYGVHGQGRGSGRLVRALCRFVHNTAVASGEDIKVIVTELGAEDEVKRHVPHWKLLSCPEDLWCIKALRNNNKNNINEYDDEDESTTPRWSPEKALFVDPREV